MVNVNLRMLAFNAIDELFLAADEGKKGTLTICLDGGGIVVNLKAGHNHKFVIEEPYREKDNAHD